MSQFIADYRENRLPVNFDKEKSVTGKYLDNRRMLKTWFSCLAIISANIWCQWKGEGSKQGVIAAEKASTQGFFAKEKKLFWCKKIKRRGSG